MSPSSGISGGKRERRRRGIETIFLWWRVCFIVFLITIISIKLIEFIIYRLIGKREKVSLWKKIKDDFLRG